MKKIDAADNKKKKKNNKNISKNKNNKNIKNKKRKRTEKDYFSTTEVLIITIIALVVGILSGTIVAVKSEKSSSKEVKEFTTAYNTVVANYYKKVNKKKLMEAAINGMFDYIGDPHTVYMDEKETESFNQTMDGSYKGIGASIQETEEGIKIVGIFDKSPAKKAGLKEEDLILEVNGTKTEGKSADETVKLIKKKDTATLKIKRKEEELTYKIKLDVVDIQSVESEIIEKDGKKVGVIRLSVFAKNTGSQFNKELASVEKEGIDALVIDVRGNVGGYLDQATEIISNFMDSSHVIYQVEKKGKKTKYYSEGKETKKYKIAVLVNGGSASASEILAAAMKESYKAEIIGTKTYGKGTVQTTTKLETGSSIKYTIESWLTPNGTSINDKGIDPTIEVELDEAYYDDPINEKDNQLQRALEEITKSN